MVKQSRQHTTLFTKEQGKTMRKSIQFAAILAAVALVLPAGAWAASVSDAKSVNITVGNALSIIADPAGAINLQFNSATGAETGSISTAGTIGYVVQANAMNNAAIPGAVSAKINAPISGMTFQAAAGGLAYIPAAGSPAGNATLNPVSTSAVPITIAGTNLFDKPVSTGNQGQVLNGVAFVSYVAVADRDLADADGGSLTVTVTLKDT